MSTKILEPVMEHFTHPDRAYLFGRDVMRAMDEFNGRAGRLPEKAIPYFADWFIFDFRFEDGETPIERFASVNPLNMDTETLARYERIAREHRFDFFEAARDGDGWMFTSLRDGAQFPVAAEKGFHIRDGDVSVARLIPVDDTWQVASSEAIGLPKPSPRDKARMRALPILDSRIVYQEIANQELADPPDAGDTKAPFDTIIDESGSPMPVPMEDAQKKRAEIENLITEQLASKASAHTLADIQDIIFKENDPRTFGTRMNEMLDFFAPVTDAELQSLLVLLSDAWNYFPHEALDGKSPAEMLQASAREHGSLSPIQP